MNKIKIVTDSTLDMPEDLIKKYDIEVVPLTVTINGENYLDGAELNPGDFITMMQEADELPKTSQPSIGKFLEIYDLLGKDGYEVLSIHMSGKMSGTVRSAEMAAQMSSSKVTVVDSKFISKALSFQVKEAAEMAKQGNNIEEILSRIEHIRNHTKLYIMLDNLDNLIKGGRIGKGKAFIGSLLNIKPIASLEAGEYLPIAKVRSRSQGIKFFVKQFAEYAVDKTIRGIGIAHAEANELAVKLKESICELTDFQGIEIDHTNTIVCTHTGSGAIALMFYYE